MQYYYCNACALTLRAIPRTFSPLSRFLQAKSGTVYFLWHYLYLTFCKQKAGPHPLDGVVLYVVRTFLIPTFTSKSETAIEQPAIYFFSMLNNIKTEI